MTERPTLRHVYDADHEPLFILPKRPRTMRVELWSYDCYIFCATSDADAAGGLAAANHDQDPGG